MKKLLQLFLTCLAFMQVQNLQATTCAGAAVGVLGPNALVCGTTNDISAIAGCGNTSYQGGNEALLTYTPTMSGDMVLDYAGISYSGIFVWDACPTAGGVCVGTPVTTSATSKTMTVPVTSGVTYFIMVDTWPTPNEPCPGGLNIAVVPPSICTPNPSSVDGSGITNVTFGAPTTVNNTTSTETGNYGDYTAMVGDAPQGVATTVDITFSTGYTYGTQIWVNWNNDFDFADAGELVYTGLSASANPSTLTASFIVPIATPIGNYTMRIGGTDTDAGPGDPCYTGSYGSFEDYTLSVTAAPSCVPPSLQMSDNVTFTSADMLWTTGGATDWVVEYGVAGFTPGTGTTVAVTGTDSLNVTGLTGFTTYDWYVRDYCGGTDSSAWVGPNSFYTGYCTPAPTSTDANGIVNVTMDTINNTTGAVDKDYGDYSAMVATAAQTSVFSISVTVQYGYGIWAWIDWNDDLDFDDANEFVFLGETTNGVALVSSITIPGTASLGNHRIRIGGSDNNHPAGSSSHDPCYTGSWGSFEDYTLNVVPAPPCVAPTMASTANVTATSADLLWTTGGATDWIVEYGPTGFVQGAGTVVLVSTTDSLNVTGLMPATAYDWYVRDYCGLTDSSSWAGPVSFTTPVTCPEPTSLLTEIISDSEVNLTWTTGGATNWLVEYGVDGFVQGAGTEMLVSGTDSLNITGLMSNTEYDWYVLDICGAADSSLWVGPFSFETPCATLVPDYADDFTTFVPNCWEEYNSGSSATGPLLPGAGSWSADGFANVGTTGAARLNIYGTFALSEWIVSPTFDLSAGGYQLVFDIAGTAYASSINPAVMGADDTLALMKSIDGGATWAFEKMWSQGTEPSLAGDRETFMLGTGAATVFAFYGNNGTLSGGDNDLFIDNFIICSPIATTSAVSICSGDSLVLSNGTSVTTAGMFNDTLIAASGCDSVVTYNVTVAMPTTSTTALTFCQGSSIVLPGGTPVSMAGVYTEVFTNAAGCDSTVTTTVSVNVATSSSVDVHLCDGAAYTLPLSGTMVTVANSYVESTFNSNGCDSIITYNVTTGMSSTSAVALSFCTGGSVSLADGTVVTAAGTYTATTTNASGCDEVTTYTVTENMPTNSSMNDTICAGDSYMFNGSALTMAGTYTQTAMNAVGCDSIITLTLTVNATSSSMMNAAICAGDSYMFNGSALTMAGTYTQTAMNAAGCDSIVTLMLAVNPTSSSMMSATICAGDSYMFDGNALTTAGTYTQTATNALGCDSIVTLTLTVDAPANQTMSDAICRGSEYTFGSQVLTAAGVYTETFTNANGCNYDVTLTLSVNNSVSTSEEVLLCGTQLTYTLANGTVVSDAGVYTATEVASNGCDSIITYNVSTCVGIANIDNNVAMTVYPNPAKDLLNIAFADKLTAVNNITVVNVLGQDVYSVNNIDENSLTINTSSLTSGIYYLHVTSDNKVSVKSFTVAK